MRITHRTLKQQLQQYLVTEETVSLGPMLTQPDRPTFYVHQQGETELVFIDIGEIDSWTQGVCADEYAEGLAELLSKFNARLMIDEANNGLVVEIESKTRIRELVHQFVTEHNQMMGA